MTNEESLEKALEEIEPNVEIQEGWSVKDKNSAEWCLSKIRDAERFIQENNALVEYKISVLTEQINKCKEWQGKANLKHYSTIEKMKSYLEPFVAQELENLNSNIKDESKKKKSISLISGRIGFKSTSHTEHDNKMLKEYILKNEDDFSFCIEYKPTISLEALKSKCVEVVDSNGIVSLMVKESGEIVPGYKIVRGKEFYV